TAVQVASRGRPGYPPAVRSPPEIRRELAEAQVRVAEIEERAARDLRAALAEVDRLEDELRRAEGLHGARRVGTVGTMEAAQVRSRGAAVSEAKTDKKTRTQFQEKLHAAKVSLPE